MRNRIRILKSKKGSATVEAALIFPIVILLLVLFEYVLKAGQTRAVVKHTASALSVREMAGAVAAPRYDPDADHLFLKRMGDSVNYVNGNTALGGSVMEASSSADIKIAIPFVNIRRLRYSASVKVPVYDYDTGNDEADGDSVWSLPSFDRGRKIEEAFGGNLPDKFETLDIFTAGGQGVKIVSVDISKQTYAGGSRFYKIIEKAVKDIAAFSGAEEEGVSIRGEDVKSRSVWIVVPEGVMSEYQRKQFERAVQFGNQSGVEVKLIEYQRIKE